ncbi:MAG: CoA transferase [bacterium]|nr:CoA transferase [bacterium]
MDNTIMRKKAEDARLCFENLKQQTGIETDTKVSFHVSDGQVKQMKRACYRKNPFPGFVSVVLCHLRLKAVRRLFKEEAVIQTGPAAAVLALNAAQANDIKSIRDGVKNENPILCDVGFAGLQVIRLYMMGYFGNKTFLKERCNSAMRVNNALNGSFYKYQTKDGRYFSAHVYYETQKAKMMNVLKLHKSPDEFTMSSLRKDKKDVAAAIKQFDAADLENKSFDSGACGCILRDRKEWEASDVGKAVCDMPLFRLEKIADTPVKHYGMTSKRGPLSGVKVLDLTHIIAGPACTRILAEQGADVLLVRRGKFEAQEQAMLELDGWAGKNSIQLDFNHPEELAKVKELIQQADVVVSSYQQGALDHFGLSPEDIHTLNPNVIYGNLMCFSDSVWKTRPGWAPLAEDITGLSIRNGSKETPVNLNGVPLDYIPGFLLANGILAALKKSMTEGGAYTVTGSLTRAGYWLHECTDLKLLNKPFCYTSDIVKNQPVPMWNHVLQEVSGTSVGTVFFPSPATFQKGACVPMANMTFTDGNSTWKVN